MDLTFDIPPAWEIPVNPIDQAQDNYAAVTSTYGTQLADEGVLYMFGIATAPEFYFPTIAAAENAKAVAFAEQAEWEPISDLTRDVYTPEGEIAP